MLVHGKYNNVFFLNYIYVHHYSFKILNMHHITFGGGYQEQALSEYLFTGLYILPTWFLLIYVYNSLMEETYSWK